MRRRGGVGIERRDYRPNNRGVGSKNMRRGVGGARNGRDPGLIEE
jgi:hypothetical protein